MRDDTDFFPKLLAISQCLCAELTVRELPDPCFCGIISGDAVTSDYCNPEYDRNGMAWVRLAAVQEVQTEGTGTYSACGTPLEAVFEVGVLRCAPGPGEAGSLPSVEQQLASARLAAADMAAALAAIRCCLPDKKAVRVLGWQPVGPEGGCVGGAWTAVVQSG